MRNEREPAGYWRLEAAADLVRLPAGRIRWYVRRGLVRPARVEGQEVLFGEEELARLRKIRRLTEDLGLNTAGVEVVLHLLDEIAALRAGAQRQDDNRTLAPGRTG